MPWALCGSWFSAEVRKRSLKENSGNYQRRLFKKLRLAIPEVSHCSGPLFTRTSFRECYTTRQLVVAISRQSISSLATNEASGSGSIDSRTSFCFLPPPFTPFQPLLRNLRVESTVTTAQRENDRLSKSAARFSNYLLLLAIHVYGCT